MYRSKSTNQYGRIVLSLAGLFLTETISGCDILCLVNTGFYKDGALESLSSQILFSTLSRLNVSGVTSTVSQETIKNFQSCTVVITSLPCQPVETWTPQASVHSALLTTGEDICDTDVSQTALWLPRTWTAAAREQVSLKSRLASHHIGSFTFYLHPDSNKTDEAATVILALRSRPLLLLTSPNVTRFLLMQVGEKLANTNYKRFVTYSSLDPSNYSLHLLASGSSSAMFLLPFYSQDSAQDSIGEQFNPCSPHYNVMEMVTTRFTESVLRICPGFNTTQYASSTPFTHLQVKQDFRPEGLTLCRYQAKQKAFHWEGTWTDNSGFELHNELTSDNLLHESRHVTLRVGALESIPFVKILDKSQRPVKYEGFCIDLINELALRINFTYKILEPPDKLFGTQDSNGTWNGMVGMLVRGEIDLAVGPFTITSERKSVIDFTVPFLEDGGSILTKRSTPGLDLLIMFRPFPWQLWLSCAMAIVTTGSVLFVITRAHESLCMRDRKYESTQWTLGECLLIIYGALQKQGTPKQPSSVSGCLVLGCWWVLTTLIVSTYTATLAAMLTVTAEGNGIDSIEALADSNLRPFTQLGTSWQTLFTSSETEIFQKIARRMQKTAMVATDDEALPLVYSGKAAYITDVSTVEFMHRKDCKNLHMAKNIFSVNGLGIALTQNFGYKAAFDSVIRRLQEVGVVEVWKRRWWRTYNDSCTKGSAVQGVKQLGFVNISGILILYSLVVALAGVCLMLTRMLSAILRGRDAHCMSAIPCSHASGVPFEEKEVKQKGNCEDGDATNKFEGKNVDKTERERSLVYKI